MNLFVCPFKLLQLCNPSKWDWIVFLHSDLPQKATFCFPHMAMEVYSAFFYLCSRTKIYFRVWSVYGPVSHIHGDLTSSVVSPSALFAAAFISPHFSDLSLQCSGTLCFTLLETLWLSPQLVHFIYFLHCSLPLPHKS